MVKVGDLVEVFNYGECYSTYDTFFNETVAKFELKNLYFKNGNPEYVEPENEFRVVAIDRHPNDKAMLALIANKSGRAYVFGAYGLREI